MTKNDLNDPRQPFMSADELAGFRMLKIKSLLTQLTVYELRKVEKAAAEMAEDMDAPPES